MIRAVLFDIGGTLIHPHPSVGAIYARVAGRHGVPVEPALIDRRFSQLWKEKKALRQPLERSWWRSLVTEIFSGHAFRDVEAVFDDLYDQFRRPDAWGIYPDVHATLSDLKSRGLILAVASNWDSRLPELLEKLGLARFFDRQFISFEMGLLKPEPAFFERILSELKLQPGEALHVGDDPEEDLAAAKAAGLKSYLLDRSAAPMAPHMIRNLREILSLVPPDGLRV